ncbi:ABC transporter ATP-binding protein [Yeosuana sp.]|uniref:ABC transporter ATP-binding protein n=1 Tax=Yeosuana sp. TaxID=2529388 RepID=UPI004054A06E
MNNKNVIEVENLTKTFGDFTAVNAISFEVRKGEIFGFLGANGAGKTTAMKMLIGISNPTSGKANVAGFDVFTDADNIKRNIGYMSQKFALYDDLTVKENITFFGGIYGLTRARIKEKANALISELGLQEVTNQLVGSLPLGWKQKLAFSVSLIHDPKIVFLDEPTGGVDPITRRQFWEMIYKASYQGTTVFVTTHYMDEAEYCDRVSIMVNGKIEALDTPKKLKEQFKADNMNDVFLKLARSPSPTLPKGKGVNTDKDYNHEKKSSPLGS